MNENLIKIVLQNVLGAIPQEKRDSFMADVQFAIATIKNIDARLAAIETKLEIQHEGGNNGHEIGIAALVGHTYSGT